MSRDISESSILTKSSEGNTTFTTRIALVIVPCVVICPGHALRIILLQSHNCVVSLRLGRHIRSGLIARLGIRLRIGLVIGTRESAIFLCLNNIRQTAQSHSSLSTGHIGLAVESTLAVGACEDTESIALDNGTTSTILQGVVVDVRDTLLGLKQLVLGCLNIVPGQYLKNDSRHLGTGQRALSNVLRGRIVVQTFGKLKLVAGRCIRCIPLATVPLAGGCLVRDLVREKCSDDHGIPLGTCHLAIGIELAVTNAGHPALLSCLLHELVGPVALGDIKKRGAGSKGRYRQRYNYS